ncbi:gluconate 2-dehydrogenase subunit 3 family protein [Fibrella forsythiae]|uniref:Gluconate 2-dehydrogenase subunit 3 family protein n=1 Tax=Fibrella forsythiae TaxID=2817061 RepID=A0ABS3JF73_9BACT|nr:gluconate 2-dehydrogenase subunit 3 family protein [Fibrella forsythiae]MBO0948635.1 gluconate 2-dehydrogenase subunit 3 family protein [Fibrella forsythiae]
MNRRNALKTSALFMGYTVSAAALTETFIACAKEAHLDWKPIFLTNNQANTIAEITETILPKTTTPGAKELGVPQFVDKMLKELLSEADQKDFLAGLDTLEDRCKSANGQSFVDCTPAQREAFLLTLDKEAAPFPPSLWGITLKPAGPPAFYRRLKSLTLLGYYTSEKIGKEVLAYDPVPGPFIACMPLNGQNAWNE